MTASTFEFSKLVFGTWRLADKHSADPVDILNRIKECLSLGIDTFDLADIYVSIRLIPRAIIHMRHYSAKLWHWSQN